MTETATSDGSAQEVHDGPDAASTSDRAGAGPWARTGFADRALVLSVIAVLVPIAVAVVRGLRRGWEPLGDNAYFLVRSRDVFTSHTPLLGTWTSASQNTPTNFNNPGPLLFDLWAVPAKLFGAPGLALGVALLNGLAVVGVAAMVRRRSGSVVAIAAVAVTGLLCWSLGSEMLYDPWQPHSLLLMFLFLLTCIWSVAAGDRGALPWMFGLASVVVQTHLSYAVLIVALVAWALGSLVWAERRERRADPRAWPEQRHRLRVAAGVTVVVIGLCWAQPLVENFTADGQGNLARLSQNMTSAERTIGVRTGTRVVADTVAVAPFWLRPSFNQDLEPDPVSGAAQLDSVSPSFPVAVLLLGGVELVLFGGAFVLGRRSDPVSAAGLVTAAVGLAAGTVTAAKLPDGVFGVAAHQFRWMWPLSAFITLVLAAALLRRFVDGTEPTERAPRNRPAALSLAAVAVLAALVTLPTYRTEAGPMSSEAVRPTVTAMRAQMGAFADQGPILIDFTGIRFAEPYSGPVMAELQRRDIPFVLRDEGLVRQFGERRRQERPARALTFRQGDQASDRVPGARRLVYVAGLGPTLRRERSRLRRVVADIVEQGLQVDPAAATAAGVDPATVPEPGDAGGAAAFALFGSLPRLVHAGAVRVTASQRASIERLAHLDARWSEQTIGLYLTTTPQAVRS